MDPDLDDVEILANIKDLILETQASMTYSCMAYIIKGLSLTLDNKDATVIGLSIKDTIVSVLIKDPHDYDVTLVDYEVAWQEDDPNYLFSMSSASYFD